MILAPAYDLLTSNSGQEFHEFAWGKYGKGSTLVNAMSECEAFWSDKEDAAKEVMRMMELVNT